MHAHCNMSILAGQETSTAESNRIIGCKTHARLHCPRKFAVAATPSHKQNFLCLFVFVSCGPHGLHQVVDLFILELFPHLTSALVPQTVAQARQDHAYKVGHVQLEERPVEEPPKKKVLLSLSLCINVRTTRLGFRIAESF